MVKVVTYRRVSTDEQADSGLGLADQETVLWAEIARREGWEVAADFVDEGFSARAGSTRSRPGLAAALEMLSRGDAEVLLAAKLDRITRSVADLATLMDDAVRDGWMLVAVDNRDVDMTTATGRLFANIMGSVSQWEREVIGERTRAALAQLKARGKRLGRPVEQDEKARRRTLEMRGEGASLSVIARALTDEGFETARGGRWHPSTVARILRSTELDEEAASASAYKV